MFINYIFCTAPDSFYISNLPVLGLCQALVSRAHSNATPSAALSVPPISQPSTEPKAAPTRTTGELQVTGDGSAAVFNLIGNEEGRIMCHCSSRVVASSGAQPYSSSTTNLHHTSHALENEEKTSHAISNYRTVRI